MRLSNNEIDEGKLTYDLALLCTKRYLDEVKFSDTVSDFEVSSGGTLAEKATGKTNHCLGLFNQIMVCDVSFGTLGK